MSFYRTLIATVAAMGLATAVFADDTTTTTTQSPTDTTATTQDASTSTTTTTDTTTTKVDLNKATAKELMKVKGLNAAKVKSIMTYRKTHGDFKTLDDLKEVKGFQKMNDKTMQRIQDQLTIG